MDSRFYGMPYFIERIENELRGMSLPTVNRAIRTYLQTRHFEAVVISDDAAPMRDRLSAGRPSPIQYPGPVGQDVLDRDQVVARLPIRPAEISILPIEDTFTGVKR